MAKKVSAYFVEITCLSDSDLVMFDFGNFAVVINTKTHKPLVYPFDAYDKYFLRECYGHIPKDAKLESKKISKDVFFRIKKVLLESVKTGYYDKLIVLLREELLDYTAKI